ncbi:unnamed protein product [Paramecium primaurelia]|uniref:Transmembrane protein n=1 Tax=Paramecium primaurelia TaxID=5886 RepID=A0A8S1QNR8_PARPR|nr:unnamed protein product [Paramecium primaurelia]
MYLFYQQGEQTIYLKEDVQILDGKNQIIKEIDQVGKDFNFLVCVFKQRFSEDLKTCSCQQGYIEQLGEYISFTETSLQQNQVDKLCSDCFQTIRKIVNLLQINYDVYFIDFTSNLVLIEGAENYCNTEYNYPNCFKTQEYTHLYQPIYILSKQNHYQYNNKVYSPYRIVLNQIMNLIIAYIVMQDIIYLKIVVYFVHILE